MIHRCPRCAHSFEVLRSYRAIGAKVALFACYPVLFLAGTVAVGTGGFVAIFMPLIAMCAMGVMSVLAREADPIVHCPECGADATGAIEEQSAEGALVAERLR